MKHFTEVEDIAFLKEMIADPPFHAKHGMSGATWKSIAEKVSKAIKREVTPRCLKDHFDILIKAFKQKEAASLAASGISEEVTEKDILLRECVELMEVPKSSTNISSQEGHDSRELGLARLRNKSAEPSEYNDSEQGASDTRSRASSRSQAATLIDLLDEQVTVTRVTSEEKVKLKRTALVMDQAKLELEQEKFKEDLRLRKKRLGAELRLQKKQQEAELELRRRQQETDLELRRKQQEADLELRRKQQEADLELLKTREEKDNSLILLLTSLVHLKKGEN